MLERKIAHCGKEYGRLIIKAVLRQMGAIHETGTDDPRNLLGGHYSTEVSVRYLY